MTDSGPKSKVNKRIFEVKRKNKKKIDKTKTKTKTDKGIEKDGTKKSLIFGSPLFYFPFSFNPSKSSWSADVRF